MKKSLFITIFVLAGLTLVVSACAPKKPPVNQNDNINATSTAEIDTSGWKIYRNEELGLSFDYYTLSRFTNEPPLTVEMKEDGTLVVGKSAVLSSLDIGFEDPVDYIKNIILDSADPNCIVKVLENPEGRPGAYKIYFIRAEDSDDPGADSYGLLYEFNCTGYAGAGATAYFVYNENVPNKLLHISIYQDPSMSPENINAFSRSIRIF